MRRARVNRREHPTENTTTVSSHVLYSLRISLFLGHAPPPLSLSAHLEPNVFAFGAGFAPLLHHRARRHNLAGELFHPCCGDPPGAVFGVGGGDRAQQKASFLDVPHFGVGVDLR